MYCLKSENVYVLSTLHQMLNFSNYVALAQSWALGHSFPIILALFGRMIFHFVFCSEASLAFVTFERKCCCEWFPVIENDIPCKNQVYYWKKKTTTTKNLGWFKATWTSIGSELAKCEYWPLEQVSSLIFVFIFSWNRKVLENEQNKNVLHNIFPGRIQLYTYTVQSRI
jgi:hypothetical protein